MDKKIEMVHFQITRNCNLRCHFCGQWGKKGFFSDASGNNMEFKDWVNVVNSLNIYRKEKNTQIDITVWGGEPLVSPYFDDLVQYLYKNNYKISIVTNGVLIDKHLDTLKNFVHKIYLSIDGTKEIHDSIRGNGVFDKVVENIKALKHPDVTVMSVITKELLNNLNRYLSFLNGLDIKELYLQDMIGLKKEEIQNYKKWLKDAFAIEAKDIISWENNDNFSFADIIDDYLKNSDLSMYNYEILHKTHSQIGEKYCFSPFKHIHVAWNGNVLYCTDFYDFSAGNVKENDIVDIFNNYLSERFRQEIMNGNCITCEHCSWKYNKMFYI